MKDAWLWVLVAALAAAGGGLLVYLLLRVKLAGLLAQLTATQGQLQEKSQRLESLEPECRQALEIKARAEQEAQRIPTLEQELQALRERNTKLEKDVSQLQEARQAEQEKTQWVEKAQAQLREAFAALASQALQTNAGEFLRSVRQQLETMLTAVRGDWTTHKKELEHLVKPLEDTLGKLDGQIRELEQKREGAYKGLDEQLRHLGQAQQSLQTATVKLEQALKSPIVRGSWGQFELRRVVELAGLEAHVHFAEQVTAEATRPDMIVYLPNRAALPVDAKAPMQAFLDAMDTSDADLRKARLKDHAGAVRSRVRELSQKRYWDQFTPSPEFVVMFVPNDTCLSAAFAQDPELLEFAFQQRVLLTTPVTLLALLKAVAYGWQQQAIAENASQIARQGKEIHDRVAVFVGHLKKTGENLGGAVQAYNAAVGSLETRLLPAVRRLRELGAATTDLPEIEAVDHQARQLDLPDSA